MDEDFFSQFSPREWLQLRDYLEHCLPICLADRQTLCLLLQFRDAISRRCDHERVNVSGLDFEV